MRSLYITFGISVTFLFFLADYVYFENSSSNPYLIRRIEELNKVQISKIKTWELFLSLKIFTVVGVSGGYWKLAMWCPLILPCYLRKHPIPGEQDYSAAKIF